MKVTGLTINPTALGFIYIKMGLNMKVAGKKINNMAKVCILINFCKILKINKALRLGQMVLDMKAFMKTVKKMVEGNFLGLMAQNMKVVSKTITLMVLVN